MTHRAESIIVAVLDKVDNLTTTTTHAYRGRVRPLQESELPALFVYLGPDDKLLDLSQGQQDWRLTLYLEAVVKTASAQVDTTLNLIRSEITVALMADHTQGLAYVLDTIEAGADAPELSGDGDQRTGVMRLTWQFHYRRSRSDPAA